MNLNREKRGHFNRLRAASHLDADTALLKTIDPAHPLLNGTPVKSNKYSDDVLIALLGLTCDCDIVAYRRNFAKEKLQKVQADILKKRFAEYVAKSDPQKAVDIENFIKAISSGLFLLVAAIDWPVGEDVLPSEIELESVDNEKHNIRLTSEAVATRARLKKEKEDAEASAKLQKEKEASEIAAKLQKEKEEAAIALEEKEAELDEKESELSDKEFDLEEKEEQIAEKEAELAVKEADLDNKAAVEKKSVSKKKNTQK